jgi:hypothetical protein
MHHQSPRKPYGTKLDLQIPLNFEIGCIHNCKSRLLGNCSLQYVICINDYIPVLYVPVRTTIADKRYSAHAEQSDPSIMVNKRDSESLLFVPFKN